MSSDGETKYYRRKVHLLLLPGFFRSIGFGEFWITEKFLQSINVRIEYLQKNNLTLGQYPMSHCHSIFYITLYTSLFENHDH